MAALACGEDRLDSTVTAPPVCLPDPPETDVAQPLNTAAAPIVPSPARKCRRLRPGVFIVDLLVHPHGRRVASGTQCSRATSGVKMYY
jgi:hypothetical protein